MRRQPYGHSLVPPSLIGQFKVTTSKNTTTAKLLINEMNKCKDQIMGKITSILEKMNGMSLLDFCPIAHDKEKKEGLTFDTTGPSPKSAGVKAASNGSGGACGCLALLVLSIQCLDRGELQVIRRLLPLDPQNLRVEPNPSPPLLFFRLRLRRCMRRYQINTGYFDLIRLLIDSKVSAFTGSPAQVGRAPGEPYSILGGVVSGKMVLPIFFSMFYFFISYFLFLHSFAIYLPLFISKVEVTPRTKLAWTWRHQSWDEGVFSNVVVDISADNGKAKVTVNHSGMSLVLLPLS